MSFTVTTQLLKNSNLAGGRCTYAFAVGKTDSWPTGIKSVANGKVAALLANG